MLKQLPEKKVLGATAAARENHFAEPMAIWIGMNGTYSCELSGMID
jgi:hypothetical protein